MMEQMTSLQLTSENLIAAVRDHEAVQCVLRTPVQTVFLVAGSLETVAEDCRLLREAGKKIFLHVDLLDGLKGDAAGIRYIAGTARPHGIISTRAACLQQAKLLGLMTILRVFLLDSLSLHTGLQHIHSAKPDFVEVMPGVAPVIIGIACRHFSLPVIAGGLIQDRSEAEAVLAAGASAVSTSNRELWK